MQVRPITDLDTDTATGSGRPPRTTWCLRVTSLVVALCVMAAMFLSVASPAANAMTAPQRTSAGTAKFLYSDINTFWTTSMRNVGLVGLLPPSGCSQLPHRRGALRGSAAGR